MVKELEMESGSRFYALIGLDQWCYKKLINNFKMIKIVNKIYNNSITYNIMLKIYIIGFFFFKCILHLENKNNQM